MMTIEATLTKVEKYEIEITKEAIKVWNDFYRHLNPNFEGDFLTQNPYEWEEEKFDWIYNVYFGEWGDVREWGDEIDSYKELDFS